MKCLLILYMVFLTGCSAFLPEITKTVEDIADDTAVNCKISKEAVKTKNLDMQINIVIKKM